MLKIYKFEQTPFSQNVRILFDPSSGAAAVIDPGGGGQEAEVIAKTLRELGTAVVEIWLTHSHLDHCGGVAALLKLVPAKLLASNDPTEAEFRRSVPQIAMMYGLGVGQFASCPEPDQVIGEGDLLKLGAVEFKVLSTPGHSPGHLCFYAEEEQLLIAGDTLFNGSIGRTDLPGSNHGAMIRSLARIKQLPVETKTLSGHGPDTTIGAELKSNPYLQ
jgi:hydroxyacylglutathione hydrolase